MILAAVVAASTTVDLSPILDPLIQIGGLVLTGLAGWIALRVGQHIKVSTQSTAMQQVVAAVDRGISFATNTLQATVDKNDKVAVANATQAAAANYVTTKLPGLLKLVGVDVTTAEGQQKVADLVTARLPPATAAPAPAA